MRERKSAESGGYEGKLKTNTINTVAREEDIVDLVRMDKNSMGY